MGLWDHGLRSQRHAGGGRHIWGDVTYTRHAHEPISAPCRDYYGFFTRAGLSLCRVRDSAVSFVPGVADYRGTLWMGVISYTDMPSLSRQELLRSTEYIHMYNLTRKDRQHDDGIEAITYTLRCNEQATAWLGS